MNDAGTMYDAVVYGATLAGVAATKRAATLTPSDTTILLINPNPGWGGVAGSGRLNSWDTREWQANRESTIPQEGSFLEWYDAFGKAYDPGKFEAYLEGEIRDSNTVDVLNRWDLVDVRRDSASGRIETVEVSAIKRTDTWTTETDGTVTVTADVFVDASDTGRLVTKAGIPHTVGREDWAEDNRQMASTLLFSVSGVEWDVVKQARSPNGKQTYSTTTTPEGNRLFWGGHWEASHADPIQAFGEQHPRFRLKAMNAAEGADDEFWLNTLLIYDVDGRYDARDAGKVLSRDGTHTPWHRDRAYEATREVIGSDAFLDAIRAYPGLEHATINEDETIGAATGSTLYLRETIHTMGSDGFALTRKEVENAGWSQKTGADSHHYDRRIGLGYYWMNSNGYTNDTPSDESTFIPTDNPVYVPYDTLVTDYCPNLLIPGYAASMSSEAWFELRVLPNLCVLGDGAGVAAAVALDTGIPPASFGDDEVGTVQNRLRSDCGARLDKRQQTGDAFA